MKTKVKKLSILATAVCAVTAGACALSACGGTNYSTYNYSNYVKENWEAKTISYQMYSQETIEGPFDLRAEYLLNLYDDGTAVLYEAGLWETNNVDNANWYNQTDHIAYAFFGMWNEGDEEILIRMVGESAGKTTVDLSASKEDWNVAKPSAKDESHMGERVEIVIPTTGADAYKWSGGDDYNYIPMGVTDKFQGAILQSQEANQKEAQVLVMELKSTATYAKLSDWVNSYSVKDGQPVTFPEGSAGMSKA